MGNRLKLIGSAALLLAAFLLGFVPQYQTATSLRNDVRSAQEELRSLRSETRIAELRDLIGLTYLESNAKNYGLAGQYSSQFFTRAGALAAETSDESLKALLTEILSGRDRVTAGLAEGKGAADADIERLVRRLRARTME